MHSLRKQTLLSTIFMIMGFAFGALSILLYTKFGALQKDEVGLMKVMADFAIITTSFASLGVIPVLYKFYPYYNDNLPKRNNELLTIITIVCLIGFIIFCVVGYFIEPVVIKKYQTNSPKVVYYYPYLFVFGFGMLMFNFFEILSALVHRSYVANFLKETMLRFITVALLVLVLTKVINSEQYLKLFSFQMIFLFLILLFYLKKLDVVHYHFKITRVTKKFWKKMLSMQSLVFSGFVIMSLAQTMDAFILSAKQKGEVVGDFALAQYGANLVSIPTKAIIGGSIGILTQAWKDKNYGEIKRLYSRSCINLSLMALFLFGNIWLNAIPVIDTLGIDPKWKMGMTTMFLLCVARCIEASTGINNIIIGTSTFWRFEFVTGIILLALRLPTAFYFISKFGLIGSAYSDILSIIVYNYIRYEYLRRKFKMQPFTYKNLVAIVLAVASYLIAFYGSKNIVGFAGIIARTSIFSVVMIAGIFMFNLTPDAKQLWDRWAKKNVN